MQLKATFSPFSFELSIFLFAVFCFLLQTQIITFSHVELQTQEAGQVETFAKNNLHLQITVCQVL